MARITPGQIVLFRFPQTDLSAGKLRPALVLAKLPSEYDDWLVCMLTTRTNRSGVEIDFLIAGSDPDFNDSGLKSDSFVRLTRLAVVSSDIFEGYIGEISAERLKKLRKRLAEWIEADDTFDEILQRVPDVPHDPGDELSD